MNFQQIFFLFFFSLCRCISATQRTEKCGNWSCYKHINFQLLSVYFTKIAFFLFFINRHVFQLKFQHFFCVISISVSEATLQKTPSRFADKQRKINKKNSIFIKSILFFRLFLFSKREQFYFILFFNSQLKIFLTFFKRERSKIITSFFFFFFVTL